MISDNAAVNLGYWRTGILFITIDEKKLSNGKMKFMGKMSIIAPLENMSGIFNTTF